MRTGIVLSLMLTACASEPRTGDNVTADNGTANTGSTPSTPDKTKPPPKPGAVTCAPDNGGITLPEGFCATIFADNLGKARQIAVTPKGYVFIAVQPTTPTAGDDHVVALFDADDNGVAEQQATIGDIGGNGIAWRDGMLYVAANDRIVRYELPDGMLTPPEVKPVP